MAKGGDRPGATIDQLGHGTHADKGLDGEGGFAVYRGAGCR
jgi:hypothetical protein